MTVGSLGCRRFVEVHRADHKASGAGQEAANSFVSCTVKCHRLVGGTDIGFMSDA